MRAIKSAPTSNPFPLLQRREGDILYTKSFGDDNKMILSPFKINSDFTMIKNWVLEECAGTIDDTQKILKKSYLPSPENLEYHYMVLMAPKIPIAKMEIIPATIDLLQLRVPVQENAYIIYPLFNPTLVKTELTFINALKMASSYAFLYLKATGIYQLLPRFQNKYNAVAMAAGFQLKGNIYTSFEEYFLYEYTLKDYKKKELFLY